MKSFQARTKIRSAFSEYGVSIIKLANFYSTTFYAYSILAQIFHTTQRGQTDGGLALMLVLNMNVNQMLKMGAEFLLNLGHDTKRLCYLFGLHV